MRGAAMAMVVLLQRHAVVAAEGVVEGTASALVRLFPAAVPLLPQFELAAHRRHGCTHRSDAQRQRHRCERVVVVQLVGVRVLEQNQLLALSTHARQPHTTFADLRRNGRQRRAALGLDMRRRKAV